MITRHQLILIFAIEFELSFSDAKNIFRTLSEEEIESSFNVTELRKGYYIQKQQRHV